MFLFLLNTGVTVRCSLHRVGCRLQPQESSRRAQACDARLVVFRSLLFVFVCIFVTLLFALQVWVAGLQLLYIILLKLNLGDKHNLWKHLPFQLYSFFTPLFLFGYIVQFLLFCFTSWPKHLLTRPSSLIYSQDWPLCTFVPLQSIFTIVNDRSRSARTSESVRPLDHFLK